MVTGITDTPMWIPVLIGQGILFDGYWEDIGTVSSFFEANLLLASDLPPFNFFEPDNPIYTHARYLPASKINKCIIDQAVVSDGCIIHEATLEHCIIGIRSIIRSASRLERTVMIGADYFETPVDIAAAMDKGIPQIGIGMNCQITNAIIW